MKTSSPRNQESLSGFQSGFQVLEDMVNLRRIILLDSLSRLSLELDCYLNKYPCLSQNNSQLLIQKGETSVKGIIVGMIKYRDLHGF
jgi:hypothetical protein